MSAGESGPPTISRSYWDTSAVINAAISPSVFARLENGEHVTRLHTLAEFFAHMTGRGVKFKDKTSGEEVLLFFTPDECAAWLREFAQRIQFEDISRDELLDGLDRAQKLSVQGARIYDYWHALAANRASAGELLTRNTDDFRGLAENIRWP